MNFYEWTDCKDDGTARQYRDRIEAGERDNPYNPVMAAMIAYEAGIREGLRRAAEKIEKFIRFDEVRINEVRVVRKDERKETEC